MDLRSFIFSFLLLSTCASFGQHAADLKSLNVLDSQGKTSKMDLPAQKHVILVMLGTDCPITQKYVPTLEHLKRDLGSQVGIIGIFTYQTTTAAMNTFIDEYKLSFPCYIDDKSEVMKSLKATVTPEAFLFDQSSVLLYSGAIDNWFYKLGSYRAKPTEHYLENALRAAQTGKTINITRTEPIGCTISKPKHVHDHH